MVSSSGLGVGRDAGQAESEPQGARKGDQWIERSWIGRIAEYQMHGPLQKQG